jgi:hypothetical protein
LYTKLPVIPSEARDLLFLEDKSLWQPSRRLHGNGNRQASSAASLPLRAMLLLPQDIPSARAAGPFSFR